MAVSILPSVLVVSLLVYGLLGAPLWLALMLEGQAWAILVALVTSIGLLVWAGQIITGGISRLSTS